MPERPTSEADNVSFRDATDADFQEIWDLGLTTPSLDYTGPHDLRRDARRQDTHMQAMEAGGRFAGLLLIVAFDAGAVPNHRFHLMAREAEIATLQKAALREVAALARSAGHDAIETDVFAEDAYHRFLDAEGFSPVTLIHDLQLPVGHSPEPPRLQRADVTFTKASSAADAKLIARIHNQSFCDLVLFRDRTEEYYSKALSGVRGVKPVLFHADVDGESAGYASGRPAKDGGAAWVDELGVVPAFRRRGVGRALLLELLDRISDGPHSGVKLRVEAGNTAALGLYAAAGFEVCSTYTRLRKML